MELTMISVLSIVVAVHGYFLWRLFINDKRRSNVLEGCLTTINTRISYGIKEAVDGLKSENCDLYSNVALVWKKLELLEEIQTHLSAKKPEKQEPKKRDQKEKAIKLINEALYLSPLSFSEIVDFLDQKKISLKKSTISVYLSNDERFESKDGKWQIKKLDESPSVSQ